MWAFTRMNIDQGVWGKQYFDSKFDRLFPKFLSVFHPLMNRKYRKLHSTKIETFQTYFSI